MQATYWSSKLLRGACTEEVNGRQSRQLFDRYLTAFEIRLRSSEKRCVTGVVVDIMLNLFIFFRALSQIIFLNNVLFFQI